MTSNTATLSPFAVFRNRNFSFLWTGQLVSTIGNSLTDLAAAIYVYRITGSALSVGLMLMATALPGLVVGLFAGVIVDRYDRKRIMIAADISRGILVLLIPFLVPYSIIWLYVLITLSSTLAQFFDPAHESVLPEIASDEELNAANSMIAISSFGSTAIGFAASGLIASLYSIEWAFYVDSLTFFISALCILMVKIPPFKTEEDTTATAVVQNLKAGIKFILDAPILRSLLMVYTLVFLSFGLWNALLLPFSQQALQASEFVFGLQEALTSVGFVLGSFLMARYGERMRGGLWIAISFLGMGIVGIFYGLSTSIPVAIILVMLSGFLNAPSSIARRTIIQRSTEREVRGRVFSVYIVQRDIVFIAGMSLAGLADVYDVRLVIIGASLLTLLAGAWALVLPGLGRTSSDWRQAISLLRGAAQAPALAQGRMATLADLDLLTRHIAPLAALTPEERQQLTHKMTQVDAPQGTVILRHNEISDAAYFIVEGQALAGREEGGEYTILEVLNAGAFFGEIAALTGIPRTADVITSQPSRILKVTAETLREMASNPHMNRIFMNKMTERMIRMNMIDLPRYGGHDQTIMRELRTPDPQLAATEV